MLQLSTGSVHRAVSRLLRAGGAPVAIGTSGTIELIERQMFPGNYDQAMRGAQKCLPAFAPYPFDGWSAVARQAILSGQTDWGIS